METRCSVAVTVELSVDSVGVKEEMPPTRTFVSWEEGTCMFSLLWGSVEIAPGCF